MAITFKNFLNEQDGQFDLELFKKDCAPFLDMIRNGKEPHLLWHGTRNYPRDFSISKFKLRRDPRDTPGDLHEILNNYFVERFGEPIRNWLFTTGFEGDARVYAGFGSSICAIFPIGKFEWACSDDPRLRDMTGAFDTIRSEVRDTVSQDSMTYAEFMNISTELLIRLLKRAHWMFNTDLVKCIASENEVMIKCDRFYLLRQHEPAFEAVMGYLTS
jgi:hypothetical protein